MNRATLIRIHMLLAAFILPVALMFLVTGGLYTWGFKGTYQSQSYEVKLGAPLDGNLDKLLAISTAELANRGIDQPTGSASLKKGGTSYKMEWTGSNRDGAARAYRKRQPSEPAFAIMRRCTMRCAGWRRMSPQRHVGRTYTVRW